MKQRESSKASHTFQKQTEYSNHLIHALFFISYRMDALRSRSNAPFLLEYIFMLKHILLSAKIILSLERTNTYTIFDLDMCIGAEN